MNNLLKRILSTLLFSIPLGIFIYFDLKHELNNYKTTRFFNYFCLYITCDLIQIFFLFLHSFY